MQTQPVSMKQLRENFSYVKSELEKGNSFTLIYRSQPIADIRPSGWQKPAQEQKQRVKKNTWRVEDFAGGFSFSSKISKKLTPEYINEIANERYRL